MESGIGNSGAGAGAASGGAGATRGFASVGGGRVNARATQGEALGGGSGLDARPGFYAPVGPPGTGFGVGAGSGAGAGPSLGEASGSGVGSSMDSDLAEMGAQRRRAAARLYGSCPICGKVMVKSSLSMHADKCAERLEKESKRSGGGKGGSQRKSQTPTPAEHRKKPGPKPGSRAKAAKRRTPEGGESGVHGDDGGDGDGGNPAVSPSAEYAQSGRSSSLLRPKRRKRRRRSSPKVPPSYEIASRDLPTALGQFVEQTDEFVRTSVASAAPEVSWRTYLHLKAGGALAKLERPPQRAGCDPRDPHPHVWHTGRSSSPVDSELSEVTRYSEIPVHEAVAVARRLCMELVKEPGHYALLDAALWVLDKQRISVDDFRLVAAFALRVRAGMRSRTTDARLTRPARRGAQKHPPLFAGLMKLLLATEAGDSSPLEMPRDVDATRVSAILKSCDVEDLVGGPVRNGSAGGSAEASVDGSDDANANAEEGDLTPLIESWACKVVGASESMAQRAHELIATLKESLSSNPVLLVEILVLVADILTRLTGAVGVGLPIEAVVGSMLGYLEGREDVPQAPLSSIRAFLHHAVEAEKAESKRGLLVPTRRAGERARVGVESTVVAPVARPLQSAALVADGIGVPCAALTTPAVATATTATRTRTSGNAFAVRAAKPAAPARG